MAKLPSVEVLRIQPLHGAGNLLCYADILIAGKITVREVRLVRQSEQSASVSGPQKSYEAHGQRRFQTYVDFPADWRPHITAAVLQAYQDHPEGILSLQESERARQRSAFGEEVRHRAGIGGAR